MIKLSKAVEWNEEDVTLYSEFTAIYNQAENIINKTQKDCELFMESSSITSRVVKTIVNGIVKVIEYIIKMIGNLVKWIFKNTPIKLKQVKQGIMQSNLKKAVLETSKKFSGKAKKLIAQSGAEGEFESALEQYMDNVYGDVSNNPDGETIAGLYLVRKVYSSIEKEMDKQSEIGRMNKSSTNIEAMMDVINESDPSKKAQVVNLKDFFQGAKDEFLTITEDKELSNAMVKALDIIMKDNNLGSLENVTINGLNYMFGASKQFKEQYGIEGFVEEEVVYSNSLKIGDGDFFSTNDKIIEEILVKSERLGKELTEFNNIISDSKDMESHELVEKIQRVYDVEVAESIVGSMDNYFNSGLPIAGEKVRKIFNTSGDLKVLPPARPDSQGSAKSLDGYIKDTNIRTVDDIIDSNEQEKINYILSVGNFLMLNESMASLWNNLYSKFDTSRNPVWDSFQKRLKNIQEQTKKIQDGIKQSMRYYNEAEDDRELNEVVQDYLSGHNTFLKVLLSFVNYVFSLNIIAKNQIAQAYSGIINYELAYSTTATANMYFVLDVVVDSVMEDIDPQLKEKIDKMF